ncbi:MAG: hypothetical protein IKA81_06735 [Alistipes sp.]|nr:hypothetical protein [Alistipes sp.]
MELITNILVEYLKHNKRIVVPKLGAFIVKQPSGSVVFSELMRSDDGVLRSLLVAYGMSEIEANGMMDRLSFEVHHAIRMSGSYTIEGFGEFVAGANNTILFKHKREPQVIGGNIKPPVDTLSAEMKKLHRAQRIMSATTAGQPEQQTSGKSQKRTARKADDDNDSLSLGKPDAYLRGLKYDKDKKKRRNDDSIRRHKSSTTLYVIIAILSLATIAAMWFVWQWLKVQNISESANIHHQIPNEYVEPIDSLQIPADSLHYNDYVESSTLELTNENNSVNQ